MGSIGSRYLLRCSTAASLQRNLTKLALKGGVFSVSPECSDWFKCDDYS